MPLEVKRLEEAVAQAGAVAVKAARQGRFDVALETVFGVLREVLAPLVESVKELRENIDRLTRNVDKLTADVGELTKNVDKLAESVARHEGAIRELRGWRTERDVADRLEAWFMRKAPEYEIIRWFKIGADLLIEGKGILAAVEITTVPYKEAVDKVKGGVGAIKEAWGREPDLLIIWSESGVIPKGVAEYAAKRGVRIIRGLRELKRLLDEVVSN